ncbi:MAG: LemA family protein [Bacteroidales bacterium]|nr:LemA family protein [Bacteroidales bacterium]
MKKTWIAILSIVAVLLIWGTTTYNRLVRQQEAVTKAWSQVENVCQRRADLVPNLVALVKNYAEYEQGTILAVTEARAKAASTAVNMEKYTESDLQDFNATQQALGQSMNRLLVAVENYPDLKASDKYLTLQAQLAGCERRILTERGRFNEAAKAYNQSVRRFPSSLIAKLFGFEKRPYFEADAGAEKVPETF